MRIVISSGHGKYVRGASGYIDEVDEARLVVEQVATALRGLGVEATTYHDDISRSQSENLDRIVDFHNSKTRDWDISVHFNAYQTTSSPMGSEVLYVSSTGQTMAKTVVDAICGASGLINRGPKKRTDLAFLNGTEMPAVLIEVCFVDSRADVDIYHAQFDDICNAIGEALSGSATPEPAPDPGVAFRAVGSCSWFGGPNDTGVSASEGLAFFYNYDNAPHLFLPAQPPGTTGLARRLNPDLFYVACRWDYGVTSKETLANPSRQALVRAKGKEFLAWPADWGPNETTGRVADLSPALMEALDLSTDNTVEVIYPGRLT